MQTPDDPQGVASLARFCVSILQPIAIPFTLDCFPLASPIRVLVIHFSLR